MTHAKIYIIKILHAQIIMYKKWHIHFYNFIISNHFYIFANNYAIKNPIITYLVDYFLFTNHTRKLSLLSYTTLRSKVNLSSLASFFRLMFSKRNLLNCLKIVTKRGTFLYLRTISSLYSIVSWNYSVVSLNYSNAYTLKCELLKAGTGSVWKWSLERESVSYKVNKENL